MRSQVVGFIALIVASLTFVLIVDKLNDTHVSKTEEQIISTIKYGNVIGYGKTRSGASTYKKQHMYSKGPKYGSDISYKGNTDENNVKQQSEVLIVKDPGGLSRAGHRNVREKEPAKRRKSSSISSKQVESKVHSKILESRNSLETATDSQKLVTTAHEKKESLSIKLDHKDLLNITKKRNYYKRKQYMYNVIASRFLSRKKNYTVSMNSRRAVVPRLFPEDDPLVIWSNDLHIGPISDLKHLLPPLGVKIIDKSLSGHCHVTRTCGHHLRVIHPGNAIDLQPYLIPMFYDAYKDDVVMQSVDAFVCFHPASLCELFMPFNKSLLVIASTRYEMGRHDPERWSNWNKNLIKISKDPRNVVAANNLYDAKYIEYFTDIKSLLLPSYCGYISEWYNASREEFLLAPIHHEYFQKTFLDQFWEAVHKVGSSAKIVPLHEKYPHYQYSDLTAHPGIVYVPYQVSVISLLEQYRMNIPLFFPSLDLLTEWQYTHHVMSERTWSQVHGRMPNGSPLPGVRMGEPDPNNEMSREAIRHWIQYSDFYQFPHIIHYDSILDLVVKMRKTDLKTVSFRMRDYNVKFKEELLEKWAKILKTVYRSSENHKTKT